MAGNIDSRVVKDFGQEWKRFSQEDLDTLEHYKMFDAYFSIFPWPLLEGKAIGFDLGCGSGRWAKIVSERVGWLHCIDPSEEALGVARRSLSERRNCSFHLAGVDEIPMADESADFGYSLGVLHHVPDTQAGLDLCVKKLKQNAPFLLYLYYRFDNRPLWYKILWKVSDFGRCVISKFPGWLKHFTADCVALSVYWPLARFALLCEVFGMSVEKMPLSYYRSKSLDTLRTDALDRFGTRLEKRFTKIEIRDMMEKAGLHNIIFSDTPPFWCAIGYKRNPGS